MWLKQFSKVYFGVRKEDIWRAWSNVNEWPKWDNELEYCDMRSDFALGTQFILKPRGGPRVKITLSEVIPHQKFTDYCHFFGATMYDDHELIEEATGLRITNTISVTGPLTFLWVHLVAKKVAASVPQNTDNLVKLVKLHNG